MKKKGVVYLIGAGPGDPGLFTLKGQRILQQADVIIYDRLVGDTLLNMARSDAEKIYVGKPQAAMLFPRENQPTTGGKGLPGFDSGPLKGDPFIRAGRRRGAVCTPAWLGF